MTDQQKTIRTTLWDAAAASFECSVGTQVLLMDVLVTYNSHYQEPLR